MAQVLIIARAAHPSRELYIAEHLWMAYTQLTQAEAALRIHKSDLCIHPIWHQRQDRVQAHILVCFLAYVLCKTLGRFATRRV